MPDKQVFMSVQDFVKAALEEIHEGMVGKRIDIKNNTIDIKFEIGVDVSHIDEAATKGGLGLSVASVFNLGVAGQSGKSTENKSYNKLSFTLPLHINIGPDYNVQTIKQKK